MGIPLEDNVGDVLRKAQRGMGLSENELLERAGISTKQWHQALAGESGCLQRLAPVLGLKAKALEQLAAKAWHPKPVGLEGLAGFNTPFSDMCVNSYLAWDAACGEAVAFDTGADCEPMLEFLSQKRLRLKLILLTHSHGDHIFELDRLQEKTGASAWIGERELVEGAQGFAAGRDFNLGNLRIETRLTWGHSRGGITYVLHGLQRLVAIVGDALFAASMGGGAVSYNDALRTNLSEIYSLPPETVLCPGHGPLTTVAEEMEHNPFFRP